ncbi:hypothetical protein GJ496_003087, partial [Pomphorhynchus laevis]
VIEQFEDTFDSYAIFNSINRIRWLSIKNGIITSNRIPYFGFLNKLQKLHLRNITSVHSEIFGFVPYLKSLEIVECSLIKDYIDLANKGHLHKITLHKTEVDFQPDKFCFGNLLLRTLSGGITALPRNVFKYCSQLKNLILSSNKITFVDNYFEEFYNSNLQLLDLSNNRIYYLNLRFAYPYSIHSTISMLVQ